MVIPDARVDTIPDLTVMNEPLISIIIAVYNGSETLQRCLDSIASQTYPHKELIIMDGGSTDGTLDILKTNEDGITYWESKPDRGIAHAWNKALKHATGNWILFLGADDELNDKYVIKETTKHIQAAQNHKKRIVYGQIILGGKKGTNLKILGETWGLIKQTFFTEKNMIPHQACFHHKSVFSNYGIFDENFSIAMDYEMLLRILSKENPVFMDMIVSKMAFGGLSHHPRTLLKMQREFENAILKQGLKPKGFRFYINKAAYTMLAAVLLLSGEKTARWYLDILRIFSGKPRVWTVND